MRVLPLRGGPRPPAPPFSRLRFTVTLVACTLVVLSTIALWWAERQLSGPIVELARLRATNLATAAINGAVREVLTGRLDEFEPVEYTQNAAGEVMIARFNMGPLNQVIAEAVQAILAALRDQMPEELRIPLGEISGLRILAGWGPTVPARILTTGAVEARPKVEFRAAGINQVLHGLYIDVSVRMVVVAPFVEEEIVLNQSVIVTEEILPGKVPDTYINLVGFSGDLSEWMALVAGARPSGEASR